MNQFLAGRALLVFMIVYNVGVGVLLLVSGELSIRFASAVLGWTIEGSPALGVAGELMGCYMIAFGAMLSIAIRDPVQYRPLVSVAILLLALRLVQRIYFADKVMETFQIPEGRYWGSCAFVALLAVLLAAFRVQLGRRASANDAI